MDNAAPLQVPTNTSPRWMSDKDFWVGRVAQKDTRPSPGEHKAPEQEPYDGGDIDTSTEPRNAPRYKIFLRAKPSAKLGRLTSESYTHRQKPDMTARTVLDRFERSLRDGDIRATREALREGRSMMREAYAATCAFRHIRSGVPTTYDQPFRSIRSPRDDAVGRGLVMAPWLGPVTGRGCRASGAARAAKRAP